MKKSLPLVAARETIADRNRLEEESAQMRGRSETTRQELGCGEPEAGDTPRPPSALALLVALDAEREKRRGREKWMPGGRGLAGSAAPAKVGKEDLSCNCAPMAPTGLVDLEAEELSGGPGAAAATAEPVPIYNAPALAPTPESRRAAVSGAPSRPEAAMASSAPGSGASRRPLPFGLMALAAGGTARRVAGRAVGQTPTTPPAPVPAGPPVPGPFPPPTYQSAGPGLVATGESSFAPSPFYPGAVPARRGPGGRVARVDRAQTGRFRRVAEESILVVRAASRAGDATAQDRLSARAFMDCMARLTSSVGDFAMVVARLRRADDAGAGAVLLLDEVDALEAFASCAKDILARRAGD